jgi:hypothetical protein
VDQVSSIGGLLSGLFVFDRFTERRVWFRRKLAGPGEVSSPE